MLFYTKGKISLIKGEASGGDYLKFTCIEAGSNTFSWYVEGYSYTTEGINWYSV